MNVDHLDADQQPRTMSQQVLFIVLGLGLGAVYAALSMGIVITYQGTGVINFAAAAMATVPLYIYSDLRQGLLTLPLPWVPSIDVGPTCRRGCAWSSPSWRRRRSVRWSQVLVSRPLRKAPVLAKVVAAVGIMLTLQAGVAMKYGTTARPLEPILPTGTVEVAGAAAAHRSALADRPSPSPSASPSAVWFRRSRTGLAIQAAVGERAGGVVRPALADTARAWSHGCCPPC